MWPQDLTGNSTKRARYAVFAGRFAAQNDTNDWYSYQIPKGASLLEIICIGAGGGGGRPGNDSVTAAGGGGGTGAIAKLIISAYLLPRILYVRPGNPGLGGTTAGASGTGNTAINNSKVNIEPLTGSATCVVSAASGGGGLNTGTGGTAGSSTNPNIGPFLSLGSVINYAGSTGTAGAAAANGSGGASTPFQQGIPISSGTGGGNGTGTGGAQNKASYYGGNVTAAAGTIGAAGQDGYGFNSIIVLGNELASVPPLIFSGGTGSGGATTAITIGNAGNGGYGCGGGGGGSGTIAGAVSGNGGAGGAGLIVIGAYF
jgi:hypothetical protein